MNETTVRDVATKAIGYQPSIDGLIGSGLSRMVAEGQAVRILRAIGIDPDMPVETLKRRLLWGERVEQCGQYQIGSDLIRYEEDGKERTTTVAWRLYLWLVRPDSPPSLVPSCQTCGDTKGWVVRSDPSSGDWRLAPCPDCCGGTGEETP